MTIKTVLAATLAAITFSALAACEMPEDSGTAADRAEVNTNKGDKASKSKTKASSPKESVSQENARKSAENYLDLSAFSRTGLIDQLKFEGFSVKDATYGVDAQKADWRKQAAAKAQEYLDMSAFSRAGLIDQLKFEGFTAEQAEYGVRKVGL